MRIFVSTDALEAKAVLGKLDEPALTYYHLWVDYEAKELKEQGELQEYRVYSLESGSTEYQEAQKALAKHQDACAQSYIEIMPHAQVNIDEIVSAFVKLGLFVGVEKREDMQVYKPSDMELRDRILTNACREQIELSPAHPLLLYANAPNQENVLDF